MDDKCKSSELGEHCWHTGSGMDSISLGNLNGKSVIHYMCCWCAQTKIEESEWAAQIPHGPHKWLRWNSDWWNSPVEPSKSLWANPVVINPIQEVCLIEEFFKQNPGATSCLIACPCSRHRVISTY